MIEIKLSSQSFRVSAAPDGLLYGTTLSLRSYLTRFSHMKWNQQLRRNVLLRRYVYYNDKTQTLHIPRYDLFAFCQLLQQYGIAYTTTELPLQYGLDVTIPIKAGITDRDERQTKAIHHLTTSDDTVRALSLATGVGKTYCLIRTLSHIGKRAMVCVGGLVEQWKEAIFTFTDLTEDDIYVIQGAPSMSKLLNQIDKTIFPKIILCSLGTTRNYVIDHVSYQDHPPFDALFDLLQVGVRAIDEVHLNFWLTMMLDLRSHAAISVVLSATFDRGDMQVKRIFDAHYPKLIRFGENEYDRYVDIYSYSYHAGNLPMKAYMTSMGYNHSKFEEWLLRRGGTKLEYIYGITYGPIIFSHYVNIRHPGQKLLILCSTRDMCQWFKQRLELDLPKIENFTINLYLYESAESVLTDSDIIISTFGSAGTGRDIKGLRTVLMTIATGSDITNLQTLGRLRPLNNTDTTVYAYVWNRGIRAHHNYQTIRRNTFRNRGRSFHEFSN